MLKSETPSLHKTKTTKSEPKQSLIRAYLKPGLACHILSSNLDVNLLVNNVNYISTLLKVCVSSGYFLQKIKAFQLIYNIYILAFKLSWEIDLIVEHAI